MPGRGPALTAADIDTIVSELKTANAHVTRAHSLHTSRLPARPDAAGIRGWTQAPVFHRDGPLPTRSPRARGLDTLRRTLRAARRHPSTLVYSVGHERNAVPSRVPGTQAYL